VQYLAVQSVSTSISEITNFLDIFYTTEEYCRSRF